MANEVEMAWLAGLLEGDGCFHMSSSSRAFNGKVPRISISMLDKDIVERVAPYLQSNILLQMTPKGDKVMYKVHTAKREVLEPLLKVLYNYLGNRRKEQVNLMLNYYNEKDGRVS